MHQTILAAFDSKEPAAVAVDALQGGGVVRTDQISLMMSDDTRKTKLDTSNDAHIAEGAAVGTGLGMLAGGLAAVGALAISGAAVVATGPLLVALGGLGVGAFGGGLTGVLVALGLPEHDALVLRQEIERGRIIVAVSTTDEAQAESAVQILLRHRPAAFRVFAVPTGDDQARQVAAARRQSVANG